MEINHEILNFNTQTSYFSVKVEEDLLTRYLKGVYRGNKPRFIEKFINYYKKQFNAYRLEELNYLLDNMEFIWDHVEPFSYKEAFEIDDTTFKSLVFSSIDIREMINNLGAERVSVEGRELVNKVWNSQIKDFEMVPYSVIYELYNVSGEKLGVSEPLSVIKCWCTTTNEEHWLWVEDGSLSPLEAIASTCVIYKSMHGKIKHIIRQGDVFLFEMIEDVMPIEDEETMSIPANEYFSLLKSQA